MIIGSGVERQDGTIRIIRLGESRENETAKEALTRVAERFYNAPLNRKKHRWIEKYDRLGPQDEPTAFLPALWVGSRLFMVVTEWNTAKREWTLAD